MVRQGIPLWVASSAFSSSRTSYVAAAMLLQKNRRDLYNMFWDVLRLLPKLHAVLISKTDICSLFALSEKTWAIFNLNVVVLFKVFVVRSSRIVVATWTSSCHRWSSTRDLMHRITKTSLTPTIPDRLLLLHLRSKPQEDSNCEVGEFGSNKLGKFSW